MAGDLLQVFDVIARAHEIVLGPERCGHGGEVDRVANWPAGEARITHSRLVSQQDLVVERQFRPEPRKRLAEDVVACGDAAAEGADVPSPVDRAVELDQRPRPRWASQVVVE